MEDELFCYERYQGFDIYVESCYDEYTNTIAYFGCIIQDGCPIEENITDISGEGCLEQCIDYIDMGVESYE